MLVASILVPLHGRADGLLPKGTRAEVFQQIFGVFLVLGTLVTVVVVGYMLYTAYRYRDGDEDRDVSREGFDPPTVGQLPTNDGGDGRKLLYSFTLSAVIVVSLVLWTYGTLLYVESGAPPDDGNGEAMDVEVVGSRFSWTFVYSNGHESTTLRVPEGATVELHVTSSDVFHTFGVPEQRVKTDAIPGQYTDTWFVADEEGTYEARCYELCGAGHSRMTAEVIVMDPAEYREWYSNTNDGQSANDGQNRANATANSTAATTANGTATPPANGTTTTNA